MDWKFVIYTFFFFFVWAGILSSCWGKSVSAQPINGANNAIRKHLRITGLPETRIKLDELSFLQIFFFFYILKQMYCHCDYSFSHNDRLMFQWLQYMYLVRFHHCRLHMKKAQWEQRNWSKNSKVAIIWAKLQNWVIILCRFITTSNTFHFIQSFSPLLMQYTCVSHNQYVLN